MTQPAPCAVPMCPNSSPKYGRLGVAYICSRHWRYVPRWMRRRRTLIEQRLKKRGEATAAPDYIVCHTQRAWTLLDAAWRMMVRAATKEAAGL